MLLQMALYHSFIWLNNIPVCVCVCIQHLYPFINWWAFRLFMDNFWLFINSLYSFKFTHIFSLSVGLLFLYFHDSTWYHYTSVWKITSISIGACLLVSTFLFLLSKVLILLSFLTIFFAGCRNLVIFFQYFKHIILFSSALHHFCYVFWNYVSYFWML